MSICIDSCIYRYQPISCYWYLSGTRVYPLKTSENLWISNVFRGKETKGMEWTKIKGNNDLK